MIEVRKLTPAAAAAERCDEDPPPDLPPGAEQLTVGLQRAAAIVAKRWTPLILYVLQGPPLRFSEMAARIPFVSDKMLSERLKELEAEGLVERRIFAEVPPRVEYRLTEKGRGLRKVVRELAAWASQWLEGVSEACDKHAAAAAGTAPATRPGSAAQPR